MRSDGEPLPDLAETVVLHRLGLVRSDDLPDIAARWLASDVVDTESVRMLAGEDPHDPWALEQLLAEAVSEANVTVASDYADVQHIVVDWVSTTWRNSGDTRWAVATLAGLVSARRIRSLTSGCSLDWTTSGTAAGVVLSRNWRPRRYTNSIN